MRDWRLPENRREAFLRFYGFHLKYRSHPGCVYSFLPAMAEDYGLDQGQREWLVWLNGNTQNPAMSLLLLEASGHSALGWEGAVAFWNENFTRMEWDTDRRHQKGKFGEATEKWVSDGYRLRHWPTSSWDATWDYAFNQPYMGRLSAWSMTEYARILLPGIPDAATLLLHDKSGSRSHRDGLSLLHGAPTEAAWWEWNDVVRYVRIEELESLGASLLTEARTRFNTISPDVSYLTMESALCTWKSWHKPNRRYPNVYSDMAYNRIRKAESRFGHRFGVLWDARRRDLPRYLRLEDSPSDPGLSPDKQNLYLETGVPAMMHREYPADMANPLNLDIDLGVYPQRKDPKWN